jgi:hypothetical protein
LKFHRAPHELSGRTRMQPQLIDNLHFSPHRTRNIESDVRSFEWLSTNF